MAAPAPVRVWEEVEITLRAEREYANPYTDVEVWVELAGPGFERRCQGFWDGGGVFRVRVVATAPGAWSWRSGATVDDPGLAGREGAFEAVDWTGAELDANPCRRGFVRAGAGGHALEHADGTPFFIVGDTWWSVPTFRFPWREDGEGDEQDGGAIGPDMSFQDMVRFRKAQGFNCIAIIAAFPAWAEDGRPAGVVDERGVSLRSAWSVGYSPERCKDMHNEGGRPFEFPGKVPGHEDLWPDVDRLNPDYFRAFDRKVAYLNSQGFVPFIEVARRDAGPAWKEYYDWPGSYVRYIRYVFARYQAANCILSPIHFDSGARTLPASEWNRAANLYVDTYGAPPFGQPVSCNASESSMMNFGTGTDARWLTLHQIGNKREHVYYERLTEIFNSSPPRPALNGEPFYDGLKWCGIEGGTEESTRNVRSGMYGSVLSGGLAGHIHGAEGLWGGDVEPEAFVAMWKALEWPAAGQMRHLKSFMMSEGARYCDLVPHAEFLAPSRSGEEMGYAGWAYCARTDDRGLFMLYFERGCLRARLSGAKEGATYVVRWFVPRTGEWTAFGDVEADGYGVIDLPSWPSGADPSETDWAMKLTRAWITG
ncbi:MAG: apiosidase-like domain-containing protein [Planctomycetota bacterium]|jgi:hypothetical protein